MRTEHWSKSMPVDSHPETYEPTPYDFDAELRSVYEAADRTQAFVLKLLLGLAILFVVLVFAGLAHQLAGDCNGCGECDGVPPQAGCAVTLEDGERS